MKIFCRLLSSILTFISLVGAANGATLIEKIGRYEINWSSGAVRFYGTSLVESATESAWRPAEQRAWADGINYLEKTISVPLGRLKNGSDLKPSGSTISLLSSVNTTYYGDSRVKVTLEAQMDQIYRQMGKDIQGAKFEKPNTPPAALKLSKKMTPAIGVTIVDENKSVLLDGKDIAYNIAQGSTANRWYKSDLPKESNADAKTIRAVPVGESTIQVASADWTPELKAAIATGSASFIVP